MGISKPWNTHFELDPEDIDLIEKALRQLKTDVCSSPAIDKTEQANVIHHLLGKIHNQKVWYNPNKDADVAMPLG